MMVYIYVRIYVGARAYMFINFNFMHKCLYLSTLQHTLNMTIHKVLNAIQKPNSKVDIGLSKILIVVCIDHRHIKTVHSES